MQSSGIFFFVITDLKKLKNEEQFDTSVPHIVVLNLNNQRPMFEKNVAAEDEEKNEVNLVVEDYESMLYNKFYIGFPEKEVPLGHPFPAAQHHEFQIGILVKLCKDRVGNARGYFVYADGEWGDVDLEELSLYENSKIVELCY